MVGNEHLEGEGLMLVRDLHHQQRGALLPLPYCLQPHLHPRMPGGISSPPPPGSSTGRVACSLTLMLAKAKHRGMATKDRLVLV